MLPESLPPHTGNRLLRRRVHQGVKHVASIVSLLLVALTAFGFDLYTSARQKVDLIEAGQLREGERVDLSLLELNAFAAKEAPVGVRNLKIVLSDPDTVSGTALVDFGKLQRAQGYQPGWLMAKLLDGERTVSGKARIRSAAGKVTVEMKQAAISGLEIDGKTLEFLIDNFVLPFYPQAIVNRPVALGFRIDHFKLAPNGVAVLIGR